MVITKTGFINKCLEMCLKNEGLLVNIKSISDVWVLVKQDHKNQ